MSESKCVKSECKKFKRKFKETISVSTSCDEYCRNIGVLCDTFMSMKYLVAVSRMQGRPLPPSTFEILAAQKKYTLDKKTDLLMFAKGANMW